MSDANNPQVYIYKDTDGLCLAIGGDESGGMSSGILHIMTNRIGVDGDSSWGTFEKDFTPDYSFPVCTTQELLNMMVEVHTKKIKELEG